MAHVNADLENNSDQETRLLENAKEIEELEPDKETHCCFYDCYFIDVFFNQIHMEHFVVHSNEEHCRWTNVKEVPWIHEILQKSLMNTLF